VLSLEVIDTVLFMREPPATLGAHEGVFLSAFVLQMTVEVIVPVVGSLTVGADKYPLRASICVLGLPFALPSLLRWLVWVSLTVRLLPAFPCLLLVVVLAVILALCRQTYLRFDFIQV